MEIYIYTLDTFISNVGGQIGLWMGCSVLTVIQGMAYLLECLRVALTKSEKWTRKKTLAKAIGKRLSRWVFRVRIQFTT